MADSQKADEVVVLGAGFSKAVSDTMPTADELGDANAHQNQRVLTTTKLPRPNY